MRKDSVNYLIQAAVAAGELPDQAVEQLTSGPSSRGVPFEPAGPDTVIVDSAAIGRLRSMRSPVIEMVRPYVSPDKDPFVMEACHMFGIGYADVEPWQRKSAKTALLKRAFGA